MSVAPVSVARVVPVPFRLIRAADQGEPVPVAGAAGRAASAVRAASAAWRG